MVRDCLEVEVSHSQGDEDVEGDGDEGGRDKAEKKQEDDIIFDEGFCDSAHL